MLSGAGPSPASADEVSVPEAPAVVATVPASDPTGPPTTELAMVAVVEDSSTTTPPAPPIPLSVAPQSITVGVGGTSRISGQCPLVDGLPLGPVEIWEI